MTTSGSKGELLVWLRLYCVEYLIENIKRKELHFANEKSSSYALKFFLIYFECLYYTINTLVLFIIPNHAINQ